LIKIPLLDKTEARYLKSLIMWDTNKWIMPKLTMASLLGKTTVINLALSPKLHHFGERICCQTSFFFTQYCLDHCYGKNGKKKRYVILLTGFILLTMPEF
jgi:hypothetical protein